MKIEDFEKLIWENPAVAAELLGVTKAAIYRWRFSGLPNYWWGTIDKITPEMVSETVEKINNKKIKSAKARGRK